MKFCSECGERVQRLIPEGDTLPRHVCPACGTIHYQNPKIVAGCIPEWRGKILLCRRAIEPRHGLWTLPAGFMENGETTQEAAVRETWEEARARVDIDSLYAVFSIPHISQVYMLFRGPLQGETYSAGPESLEVALFDETDIPWQQIAFPVIRETLVRYYQDRHQGTHRSALHLADLRRAGSQRV